MESVHLGTEITFEDKPTLASCSSNECLNGHHWQPQIMVAKCEGCAGPVLAIRMLNCPICNEPTKTLRLLTHHLSTGMKLMPMCKPGVSTQAEVVEVILDRTHYQREDL